MKNGLEEAYNLVVEKTKEGIVNTSLKTGQPAMGDLKQAKGMGPSATDVKCPEEAEEKINPGHGKIKTESTRGLSRMLPQSKFDSLFNDQIISEDDELNIGDESPVEMEGDGEFNDDLGDFPEDTGDETNEEVDVATELRLIIDRLTEVAEKLGSYDDEIDDADMDTEEAGLEDDLDVEPPVRESAGPGKGAADGKLKPFPNKSSQMQSKGNKVVKSAFKPSGKTAATGAGGPGKGAADGKLKPFRKTSLGPKTPQKHTEVKGTMSKPGAGLFDSI